MKQNGNKRMERGPIISMISLGCSKNQVDSERLLGDLVRKGFLIAGDPADADICLVNTCGFIDEARQETSDVLKELKRLKKEGLRAVVALGCMVERFRSSPELGSFLEEADARVGFNRYGELPEICEALLKG
ncbi:MAG: 30S ribosomal protein S12 methylthiotransferase RimO, partial [Lentisphaerota bacterium]